MRVCLVQIALPTTIRGGVAWRRRKTKTKQEEQE
jgi:hypothetical protein